MNSRIVGAAVIRSICSAKFLLQTVNVTSRAAACPSGKNVNTTFPFSSRQSSSGVHSTAESCS